MLLSNVQAIKKINTKTQLIKLHIIFDKAQSFSPPIRPCLSDAQFMRPKRQTTKIDKIRFE